MAILILLWETRRNEEGVITRNENETITSAALNYEIISAEGASLGSGRIPTDYVLDNLDTTVSDNTVLVLGRGQTYGQERRAVQCSRVE